MQCVLDARSKNVQKIDSTKRVSASFTIHCYNKSIVLLLCNHLSRSSRQLNNVQVLRLIVNKEQEYNPTRRVSHAEFISFDRLHHQHEKKKKIYIILIVSRITNTN